MNTKPRIKKADPLDDVRRLVRGLQKAMAAVAEIDPETEAFAIELGRELESKRRKKKAVVKLAENRP